MAPTEEKSEPQGNTEQMENIAVDQERDTFLPRPSDDPNDPLNFPIWLKVDITPFTQGFVHANPV
jgi:hypothetical protein